MLYSVPYDYIKHHVDVRITQHIVEIFYKHLRIASHKRIRGKEGQHATHPDHMPKEHKQFIDLTPEAVREWATSAGTNILTTMQCILSAYRTEKQALKSCLGLMKLADKHSIARVEKACERALSYTPRPTLMSVQTILKTGQDKLAPSKDRTPIQSTDSHGFTRGAAYYGGKRP